MIQGIQAGSRLVVDSIGQISALNAILADRSQTACLPRACTGLNFRTLTGDSKVVASLLFIGQRVNAQAKI